MQDPIVEELHRMREERAAHFHYDLDAIVEDLMRSQAQRDWPRASFSPRRLIKPAEAAKSALPRPVE